MCSRNPHHGVSRPRCSATITVGFVRARCFASDLEPKRVRWKYDQVHTTLQRRKGLKTVSSLCTTEVQVVRWSMDQLYGVTCLTNVGKTKTYFQKLKKTHPHPHPQFCFSFFNFVFREDFSDFFLIFCF